MSEELAKGKSVTQVSGTPALASQMRSALLGVADEHGLPVKVQQRMCLRCRGQGVFIGARPKGEKPQPDQRCGQCDEAGVVWVEVAK